MVTIILKIVIKLDRKRIPTRVSVITPKNILHNIGTYSERDLAFTSESSWSGSYRSIEHQGVKIQDTSVNNHQL